MWVKCKTIQMFPYQNDPYIYLKIVPKCHSNIIYRIFYLNSFDQTLSEFLFPTNIKLQKLQLLGIFIIQGFRFSKAYGIHKEIFNVLWNDSNIT